MARSSRETAALRREQVVLAAARRVRERGLAGVSVPDLMAEAGLTHGGFYKHFTSKDALEAEACERALEEMAERVWALVEAEGPDALAALITFYLTPDHRDDPGGGCAITALAADASRSESAAAQALASGIERQAEILSALAGGRPQALATLSTLVGAVILARATKGRPVSDEILDAARAALT